MATKRKAKKTRQRRKQSSYQKMVLSNKRFLKNALQKNREEKIYHGIRTTIPVDSYVIRSGKRRTRSTHGNKRGVQINSPFLRQAEHFKQFKDKICKDRRQRRRSLFSTFKIGKGKGTRKIRVRTLTSNIRCK